MDELEGKIKEAMKAIRELAELGKKAHSLKKEELLSKRDLIINATTAVEELKSEKYDKHINLFKDMVKTISYNIKMKEFRGKSKDYGGVLADFEEGG